MNIENLSTLKINKLTQEQYDRELAVGNIDENALYLTPEENIDLSGYATIEEMNDKADKEHNHDDIYYTETEIDQKLSDVNISITNITSGSTSVKEAEHAGNADTATNATQDASGNVITSTYETKTNVSSHTGNKSNPHAVTKSQVGLGNVPNVATNDQTPTFTQASSRANIASGEKLSVILGKIMKYFADLKTVAFTGSYNDLSNKPTIPSAYTHPTSSGNKHIPSGGSSGQILRWSADGTAAWGNDNNTTYSNATTETNGLMSSSDKTKLNGIASGANKYTHPSYTARTGVPTGNQAPGFGGTFTVTQPVSDGTGHITAMNSRTITIPNAVATTSANGLMSASDKTKLDSVTAPVSITQADYTALGTAVNTNGIFYLVK